MGSNERDRQSPEIHYWNSAVEHLAFWHEAVSLQADRLRQAAGTETPYGTLLSDALFLLVALHRLRRACSWAGKRFPMRSSYRSRVDKAMSRFDTAFPGVKNLRDATEHFDQWIEGKGHGQEQPSHGGYPFRSRFAYTQRGDRGVAFTVEIDDMALDVLAAAGAALAMATEINDAFNNDADERYGPAQ